MGRGNVCVHGKYEGLYYVDRDYLDCYSLLEANEDGSYDQKLLGEIPYEEFSKYEYDEYLSLFNYENFINALTSKIEDRFKSFCSTGKNYGVILENNLFQIEIEDNEWSYAVKLLQKEQDYYSDGFLEGLQARHYKEYLDGLQEVLFDLFPSIGTYAGAWTSGRITREEFEKKAS